MKRINQIIKITLRFVIINYLNINYVLILSILTIMFNNSINVVIDLSINKIFYNFKMRDTFFEILFNDNELLKVTNLLAQRLKY